MVIEETSDGMPEEVLNGCYDEAAEFIHVLIHKESPRPSIAEVFPSVKLCLELAKIAGQDAGSLAPARS
jgi:hypothetical protein